MTALVFVDTNLFVYAHQANEPLKQPVARRWLERLWGDHSGRTSVQVLNEYYATLTRRIKPGVAAADAWDAVRNLMAWNPQPIDCDLLSSAHEIERRYQLSWWDSLIVGSAQAQSCSLLLTEDLQDRALFGTVTVRNPFVLGVAEPEAEYAITAAVTSRHRPRGRPKRVKDRLA